jgi:hypothetical protein
MISLRSDCLIFQLTNGECIPCSPDMISVEIVGEVHQLLDSEMLRHAAASVFHYFKNELERECITISEFSSALEKVLDHLGYTIHAGEPGRRPGEINEADLLRLVHEAGDNRELSFFPRLRDELRIQLRQSPRVVRFHGLRGCVKQLAGVRRWSPRCEHLQDQIVEFLRGCLTAETEQNKCALVVE